MVQQLPLMRRIPKDKITDTDKHLDFLRAIKKHLREYNNVVLSDDQLSKIKAHLGFLGKIVYPLDKVWKLTEA